MADSDSQIDKPQRERPNRIEVPDVNTGKALTVRGLLQKQQVETSCVVIKKLLLCISVSNRCVAC